MKPLKIVIICSYTIPRISPRSFRSTELAKELASQGHRVIFYAMLGKKYDYFPLLKETGLELRNLGKPRWGLLDSEGYGNKMIYKLIAKLLGRLTLYPDILLIPLIKQAIKKESDIDLLVTIAHPHSIHMGVSFAKSNNVKCWVADCGDPLMGNHFTNYPFYFKYLEKRWCKKVDFITVPIKEAKSGYYKEFKEKIHVIPQGFDFSKVSLEEYKKNDIPTFAYAGNLYKNRRDITDFLCYLCTLKIDFKFIVYTRSLSFFIPFESQLGKKLELRDYIPREILLKELSKMDFLVNVANDSSVQQPSKLIDYFLVKRPILEISSNFVEQQFFEEFLEGNYNNKLKEIDISHYDIKNVASRFLDLYYLKQITK